MDPVVVCASMYSMYVVEEDHTEIGGRQLNQSLSASSRTIQMTDYLAIKIPMVGNVLV